jgi:DNA-binding CsgD family transcriptional regulator
MDVFFAHARAALRQRRWLARVERERDATLAWMDCWRDPTFILDSSGALIVSNLAAERMLHQGTVLVLRSGRVHAAGATDNDWVGLAIRSLLAAPQTPHGGATRCIPVVHAEGRTRLHAIMTLMPKGRADARRESQQIALILRDLHQAVPQFETEQLRDLFGFTAAETRVANALLAGRSVDEIAAASQVRRDTVRAHVKRLLAKTGTRKQSDLQRILVKAVPNLRSLQTLAPFDPDDDADPPRST